MLCDACADPDVVTVCSRDAMYIHTMYSSPARRPSPPLLDRDGSRAAPPFRSLHFLAVLGYEKKKEKKNSALNATINRTRAALALVLQHIDSTSGRSRRGRDWTVDGTLTRRLPGRLELSR